MRRLQTLAVTASLLLFAVSAAQADHHESAVTPDDAMEMLKDGNARFAAGEAEYPNFDAARRAETSTKGQHPFVTVIACSDSRVPVEVLFDQGIGDVFVIRVAGNVSDTDEIGSIEYGVEHLGTPLMVVLGHSQCGAVTAVATSAEVHGSIPELVDNIGPAVASARAEHPEMADAALVPYAIEANVWQSVEDLLTGSPGVAARVAEGKTRVVGAVYDIASGKVNWMGQHPEQASFLKGAHGGH